MFHKEKKTSALALRLAVGWFLSSRGAPGLAGRSILGVILACHGCFQPGVPAFERFLGGRRAVGGNGWEGRWRSCGASLASIWGVMGVLHNSSVLEKKFGCVCKQVQSSVIWGGQPRKKQAGPRNRMCSFTRCVVGFSLDGIGKKLGYCTYYLETG